MDGYHRDEEVLWLEWEDSTRPLEVNVRERGGLPAGLEAIRISRREDLSIEVTGTTAKAVASGPHATQPGELLPDPPATIGTTLYESTITLDGVWIEDESWSSATGTTVKATARSVRETSSSPGVAAWHSEWLANYSSDHKVHPRKTRRTWVRQFARGREDQAPLHVDLSPRTFGSSRDHIRLKIDVDGKEWIVRIGAAHAGKSREKFKPGFMEFECDGTAPPEDLKASVLDAVSFALGRRILSIGGRTFNAAGEPLITEMRHSAFLRYERTFRSPSAAPTPFWDGHVVDEARVQRVVSAVLSRMEDLKLRHPLMLASAASLGFIQETVVGLAAAIEALRDASRARSDASASGILPSPAWQSIKDALLEQFDTVTGWSALGEKPPDLALLRSKLSQVNEKSSRQRFNDFFMEIGLPVGAVELEALRRRNMPAHGFELSDAQVGALVLTNEALRTLFNRVILRLTGGADEYIDYSTYGFPVRPLTHPLGGPNGDGRPGEFHR